MSDTQVNIDANSNGHALADLERRVQVLEAKIALVPDSAEIEKRVAERVQSSLPPPAPPIDPTREPGLADIQMPIPSVQNVVAAARTGWTIWEMFGEMKALFWTLFDRRYHRAWMTRVITLVLVALILVSQWWVPLAKVDFIGGVLDKIADLLLCVILFALLSIETRRYKEWRSGQPSKWP